MSRHRLLVLALTPTLVLGLAIGGFVVVDARARQADVERADAAASAYTQEVARFRTSLVDDLEAVDDTDPADVADVVEASRDDVPELAAVPQRGEEGSSAYTSARSRQTELGEALERLDGVVDASISARTFVLAANRALGVNPQDLAPTGVVSDGSPLRQQLLPPLRSALATFEAVEAPDDAKEAREAVRTALQHVITEGEALAAKLDARQSGSFEYAQEYTTARSAVRQYADGVRADLREALDGVVADPTIQG